MSKRSEFIAGLRAEAPILIGVIPFGVIYGVLAISAAIPMGAAQAMSSIIFAGSSQILATQLIHQAAPALVIIITVGVVNLRHALYSASVAPYLQHLRPVWKWLLAYLLTDEAYAVSILHYQADESDKIPHKHWFFLGAGMALWSSWQLSTLIGITLGAVIPESWSLDFTLALTFIALVIINMKDWPSAAAALVAGLISVLVYPLPYGIGLIMAAAGGIMAGILIEKTRKDRHKRAS